jgi:hypothetical protein
VGVRDVEIKRVPFHGSIGRICWLLLPKFQGSTAIFQFRFAQRIHFLTKFLMFATMRLAMAFVVVRYEDFQRSLRREALATRHNFREGSRRTPSDCPQVTILENPNVYFVTDFANRQISIFSVDQMEKALQRASKLRKIRQNDQPTRP